EVHDDECEEPEDEAADERLPPEKPESTARDHVGGNDAGRDAEVQEHSERRRGVAAVQRIRTEQRNRDALPRPVPRAAFRDHEDRRVGEVDRPDDRGAVQRGAERRERAAFRGRRLAHSSSSSRQPSPPDSPSSARTLSVKPPITSSTDIGFRYQTPAIGMITTPSRDSSSALRRAIEDSGVSRRQRINRMRSLIAT